jgi:hypothetical protein
MASDTPAPSQDNPATPGDSNYGGPSVLVRGGSASIGGPLSHVRLRPFISLSGIWDSGLGNTIVNSQGAVPYVDAYGIQAILGVSGTRRWKNSALELDYRGSLRHYTEQSYYDGIDNSLALTFKHYLSPRTQFVVSETAARYSRAFALPMSGYYNTGFQSYDPTFSGLTTNDFYDTPTTALISNGRLVHELTERLSVSASVSGFFIRRRSEALIGSNGYSAQGDISYRLTRYQTVTLEYIFTHYDFNKSYGQSDMHGASLGYAIRMGRHMELAFNGGVFRVESARLTRITFDPVIAALLGQAYGFEKFHGVTYVPRMSAHLTRTFRNSSVSAGYDRTVVAGNGVYTTAGYESGSLGYSYTGIRNFSVQTAASYQRYSALSQTLGRYRSFSGGAGIGYNLGRGLSLGVRGDVRRYYVHDSGLNRLNGRVEVGFSWSPGEYPLALW